MFLSVQMFITGTFLSQLDSSQTYLDNAFYGLMKSNDNNEENGAALCTYQHVSLLFEAINHLCSQFTNLYH